MMMQTSYIKIRFEWFVMSSINQSFEEFVSLIKKLGISITQQQKRYQEC
jgi:hypothetical protein